MELMKEPYGQPYQADNGFSRGALTPDLALTTSACYAMKLLNVSSLGLHPASPRAARHVQPQRPTQPTPLLKLNLLTLATAEVKEPPAGDARA